MSFCLVVYWVRLFGLVVGVFSNSSQVMILPEVKDAPKIHTSAFAKGL